jgi:hypothetical protein
MSRSINPRIRFFGLALAVAAGVTFVPAQQATAAPPDASAQRSGAAAIDALGSRMDAAAKSAHLTVQKLKETLLSDESLKVDRDGHLLYVDAKPQQSGTSITTGSATTPVYDISQTFALHSKSSSLKIYLDFTGHTTSGTRWNQNFSGGQPFTTPAYDSNGNRGTWSSAEHAAVQSTWLSVREDFAPFNVDVTTQDPGYEGLRYSGAGDTAYGVRVVIGPNTWYPYSAGGVGYVDTFGAGDTPVYVFGDGSAGTKFIAEASSHETGHAFGLSHDGTATADYYGGHGYWAPIMGNSYGRPVTQWSAGEYAGANNTQNDLNLIARYTGWTGDDYAGTTATAGTLPAGTRRYGTINWTGEVDAFRFSLSGQRRLTISTSHNTGPVDPNLNMRLVLRDPAGSVIATSSPAGDLRTAMTVTLPAGTYYAYVDGVGDGSPWNTGWSAYASLGFYGIQLDWA